MNPLVVGSFDGFSVDIACRNSSNISLADSLPVECCVSKRVNGNPEDGISVDWVGLLDNGCAVTPAVDLVGTVDISSLDVVVSS